MHNFDIINIRDTKQLLKYTNDPSWRKISLIPLYSEGYCCFASNREFNFDELIDLFLHGSESDRIGSISLISEHFSSEFRNFVCDNNNYIPRNKVEYLINNVVPSFLPLLLPKDKIIDYVFDETYSDDHWVQTLQGLKKRL